MDAKAIHEIDQMILEKEKLKVEIRKLMRDTLIAPFVAGAAVMAASTGLAALVIQYLAKH
jgi:hypothetical protein